MPNKSIYNSRVGRYDRKSVADLERLEAQHIRKLQAAREYVGYYPNRDSDIEKEIKLIREIKAVRDSKILQRALL